MINKFTGRSSTSAKSRTTKESKAEEGGSAKSPASKARRGASATRTSGAGGGGVAMPPSSTTRSGDGGSSARRRSSSSSAPASPVVTNNNGNRRKLGGGLIDRSDRSARSGRSMETKDIDNSSTNRRGGSAANAGGSFGTTLSSVPGGSRSIRRYSSNAQSSTVSNFSTGISISSASVFAPSVYSPHTNATTTNDNDNAGTTAGRGGGGNNNNNIQYELQPSSARLLQQWNKSANSSLLSSLGTAATKTFRSYKMTLPRFVPPPTTQRPQLPFGIVGDYGETTTTTTTTANESTTTATPPPQATPVESDLELLGRTVHAVSSALTEPPKVGNRYIIYDVSFNPRGCVWDALLVIQMSNEDGDENNDVDDLVSSGQSSSNNTSGNQSKVKGGGGGGDSSNMTFTFPIRVMCAEDDDDDEYDDDSNDKNSAIPPANSSSSSSSSSQQQQNQSKTRKKKRAKTYAVDVSVVDDSPTHPISRWTTNEQSERRDDVKNAMEWISYTIRRSMARSMFPKFPEGCQGRPFREVYQLNKKLKSGTFSTVCRGVHRITGQQVAVKCILRKKIEPSVDAAVFEEVLIMSGLHHKYICPMIDYFEEDRCHFVVMELERGGDLCERLNDKGTYSEDDARKVVRNICEAMDFVHTRGFAHCDIKPRNYLLRSKNDDVDVRLADFGFAQHVHAPNSLTSQCGTPFFVAPEVINRMPYDQKVDMWSIGVTTYLLLCGDTPFNGKNRQQLFRRISCDEPPYADDKWGHISDEGIDFVQKLLMKDPVKRLSSAQALSHRWLMKGRKEPPQPLPAQSQQQQQQQQQQQSLPQVPTITANVETRPKSGGTNRGPTSGVSVSRSREEIKGRGKETVKRTTSREPPNRSNKTPPPTRTVDRVSASRVRETRSTSKSRERTVTAGGPPPPPPLPSSTKGQTPILSSSSVTPKMMEGSVEEVNARLLDVIRVQDAKIEQLERLLKRMLDHEDEVHK